MFASLYMWNVCVAHSQIFLVRSTRYHISEKAIQLWWWCVPLRQYARLSSSQILLNVIYSYKLLRNFSWTYFVHNSCLQKKRYYARCRSSPCSVYSLALHSLPLPSTYQQYVDLGYQIHQAIALNVIHESVSFLEWCVLTRTTRQVVITSSQTFALPSLQLANYVSQRPSHQNTMNDHSSITAAKKEYALSWCHAGKMFKMLLSKLTWLRSRSILWNCHTDVWHQLYQS